jgi:hypothetical protein
MPSATGPARHQGDSRGFCYTTGNPKAKGCPMPDFKTVEIEGASYKIRYPVKRLVACVDYVFEISGKLTRGSFSHQPSLQDALKPNKAFIWVLYAGGKRVIELRSLSELPSSIVVIGQVVK